MKYIVKSTEFGLMFKKQNFVKVLKTGEYKTFDMFVRKQITIINKRYSIESYGIDLKTINNKTLNDMVTSITVKDYEVAFHYIDGVFTDLLNAGTHSYFNDVFDHQFIVCDTRDINIPEDIDKSIFNTTPFTNKNIYGTYVTGFIVSEGYVGALKVNGKFEKILEPGRYYFFTKVNEVSVKQIDLRIRTIQISGQELLTGDKVNLRINFVLKFKVTDSVKVVNEFESFDDQLYLTMQLALREYVSSKNLDELLAEKHEIGKIILESVKSKETDFGAEFMEAGIKDIILPGDIKEILNSVLIAEKKALANVITRREETASTRSLLNTARLMDENTTLYKLKELEYLEKICDKVGNISLSSSGGILEQLSTLIKK